MYYELTQDNMLAMKKTLYTDLIYITKIRCIPVNHNIVLLSK